MVRQAFVSAGVAYHHALVQPGQPLADFDVVDLGRLAEVDLNAYELVVVPRSADGDALFARRYQFARFLDHGGVLIAFGELWADWFPGCRWQPECAADLREPVIARDHPIVAGFDPRDLHWHPAQERWCCHGHLVAPAGAEVLVANARGDAWLYVDSVTTNGVIVASSNLDPDTHAFHGSDRARVFFDQLLDWARDEAAATPERRQRPPRIAGLSSGVHFQRAFYADPEFAERYAVLPVWELAATDLHDYAALWIPRESNQAVLLANREQLTRYLAEGGTIVCFDEVNQPWLPAGASWALRPANLETIRLGDHPIVAGLTPDQVRWHSHGVYDAPEEGTVLIEDGEGGAMLFLDESRGGALLAGTIDPDCHAGFGAETTRPLLRAILAWVAQSQRVPAGVA